MAHIVDVGAVGAVIDDLILSSKLERTSSLSLSRSDQYSLYISYRLTNTRSRSHLRKEGLESGLKGIHNSYRHRGQGIYSI